MYRADNQTITGLSTSNPDAGRRRKIMLWQEWIGGFRVRRIQLVTYRERIPPVNPAQQG